MDECRIKDLVAILSAADSVALSWVWQRCWESCFIEPGDDIFRRSILESGVNLLLGSWNSILEERPENDVIREQRGILLQFATDLVSFENLILDNENHVQMGDGQHQERLHKQDDIDIDRANRGLPLLLPFFYRPQNGPLLRFSESTEYKHVSGDEYAEAYRSRYRWVHCPGGVRQQLKYIDLWRQGKGYPILLPIKFRLYYPGLTWDGIRSLPRGERYRKKGVLINGVRYQYVSRHTFTKVYGLSERIDITPVKRRISCAFIDEFSKITDHLKKNDTPAYLLAQAISKCQLGRPQVASMECSVIPDVIARALDILKSLSPTAGSEVLKWMEGQFEGWIVDYRERKSEPGQENAPIDLSWELFKQVYFCLREGQNGHGKSKKAPAPDSVVIPQEHRTAMMSMTYAAKYLNITPKKLKKIVDERPGCRMHIEGQSYVFDTRIPPLDELKAFDPPQKRKK